MGWDWFMGQFDGDKEITLAAPHTDADIEFFQQTGPESPGVMEVVVTGKYVDKTGNSDDISGTLKIDKWVKSEKSSDPEKYWITHTWYPNRGNFTFNEILPRDIRNFQMTPVVDGGQSGFNASDAQYSGGGVYIKNLDGKLIGRGFAESVYYDDVARNMLYLAGLPVTDEMLSLVRKPYASSILKIKSILKLLTPTNRAKVKKILDNCMEEGLPKTMIG